MGGDSASSNFRVWPEKWSGGVLMYSASNVLLMCLGRLVHSLLAALDLLIHAIHLIGSVKSWLGQGAENSTGLRHTV